MCSGEEVAWDRLCQRSIGDQVSNTDEETSWLLASELRHASEVVSDFHQAFPSKPGPLLLAES